MPEDFAEQTIRDAAALARLKASKAWPALERLVEVKVEQLKESLLAPDGDGAPKVSRKQVRAAIAALRDLMASVDAQIELAKAAEEEEREDKETFAPSRVGRGDLAV